MAELSVSQVYPQFRDLGICYVNISIGQKRRRQINGTSPPTPASDDSAIVTEEYLDGSASANATGGSYGTELTRSPSQDRGAAVPANQVYGSKFEIPSFTFFN